MTRKQRWIGAAAVVAVLVLASLSRLDADDGKDNAAARRTGQDQPLTARRESTPAVAAAARRAPASALPLPPPDAPVAQTFKALAAAADAGDIRAACRLAWDLERCHRQQARAGIGDMIIEGAAREQAGSAAEAERIERLVAERARVARDDAVCAGLEAERLAEAPRRMLQAAQLGHPASQAMFAAWPPFSADLSLEQAELAIIHRQQAMGFLRRAAATGEPAALFVLLHACHFGEIRLRHGVVEVRRDPACALAAALALERVADPLTREDAREVARASAGMLPRDVQRQAQTLADAYADQFKGRPGHDFASGVFSSMLEAPCSGL